MMETKIELPKEFEEYISKKLENGKKGRKHLVNQLGSMDRVLEFLADAWIEQLEPKALCKKYGIGYYQFYRFLKDVEQYKEQIIAYINYIEEVKPKNFRSYAIVQEWEAKIRRSGHLSSLRHIPVMANVLGFPLTNPKQKRYVKGFRCSPDKFDLQKAQEFIDLYLKQHPNKTKLPRNIIMAIRHFLMVAKNVHIPRGFGAQYGLSGEKTSYGKYAHIRLSEEQIRQIREILENDPKAKELGYDIAFEVGIQTCSRAFAIASIQISMIQKVENLYIIKVFEPKVKANDEHLGKVGKYWTKYISKGLYERIQEYIKEHPKRALLFVDEYGIKAVNEWLNGFRKYMKEVYRKIGITEQYFYSHPIHALRHAGAIRLLELTDWNYELVARLGGWTNAQTLRDCYGAMPEEVVLRVVSRLEHQLNGE